MMLTRKQLAEEVKEHKALYTFEDLVLIAVSHRNNLETLRASLEVMTNDYAAAQHLADATSKEWQACKQQLAQSQARVNELEAALRDRDILLSYVLEDSKREERYTDDAQDYCNFCGMHSEQHQEKCCAVMIKAALISTPDASK